MHCSAFFIMSGSVLYHCCNCQLSLLSVQLFTCALIAYNVTAACIQHVVRPPRVARLGSTSSPAVDIAAILCWLVANASGSFPTAAMAAAEECASLQGLHK